MVECCTDGCPSVRFSHLHKRSLDLIHNDHWVFGYLFDQGPSSPITGRPDLGRLLLVPNLFHFRLPCSWALSMLRKCSRVLLQIFVLTQSCLAGLRIIFGPHGLVFSLVYTINCETLNRQMCAFPNYIQGIKGGLQSNC